MSEYAPGTVAVATVRGVEGVRVMRVDESSPAPWRSSVAVEYCCGHSDSEVTDVRPLVVLDLAESPFGTATRHVLRSSDTPVKDSLIGQWIADQIEAQTKPPRIPEPGLWGVVEATAKSGVRKEWVRTAHGWSSGYFVHPWGTLIDPVLIRPGLGDDGA